MRPGRATLLCMEAEDSPESLPPADAVARKRRWYPICALGAIILAFVALASFIAIRTPAYESADEPGHVQNIETLVRGHWYGMDSRCEMLNRYCSGTEAHQAPLYYLAFAGWQRLVGVPARATYHGQSRLFDAQQGTFLHHSNADRRFLLWLRLPNVLLGALTVLVTFFAVRLVSSDPWTPVVGASIVAFLPRFVFLSAFVTNDNLVDLLGAVLVLLALRFTRRPTGWRMAWLGFAFGLLVATKLSALPVGLVLIVLAFMVRGWRRRGGFLAIGALTAFAACGWYLIQNTVRYGDPLARAASARYLAQVGGLGTFFIPYVVSNPLNLVFVRVPQRIADGFWYVSGSVGQFHWPWPVSLVFWAVLAASVAGIISRHIDRWTLATLLTVAGAGLLSVWIVAFQTSTYEARYVYVGLSAIAALVALGLERWRLPVRLILPVMGLVGTVVAIQQNVLAVHWG
jgi:hypothetical protein